MSIFDNAKSIKVKPTGKVSVRCRCGKDFTARAADIARGWGKFCSKKCKAIEQEQRTGQYANYQNGVLSSEGSNRWVDDDGNRCTRVWGPGGRSLVSTTDKFTGEVGLEQFDRYGNSDGVLIGPGDFSNEYT